MRKTKKLLIKNNICLIQRNTNISAVFQYYIFWFLVLKNKLYINEEGGKIKCNFI
jgi:hypothetical protein